MPWCTDDFNKKCIFIRNIIEKEFEVKINTSIYLCTSKEMKNRLKKEGVLKEKYNPEIWKIVLDKISEIIHGKYWKSTNEIWIVNSKGEDIGTIFHEYLHSIQKCTLHREPIVEYLTYFLLNKNNIPYSIQKNIKEEWNAIKEDIGLDKIKERMQKTGDCEDF